MYWTKLTVSGCQHLTFLSDDRFPYIDVHYETFVYIKVSYGVPQGSVFGLILFIYAFSQLLFITMQMTPSYIYPYSPPSVCL